MCWNSDTTSANHFIKLQGAATNAKINAASGYTNVDGAQTIRLYLHRDTFTQREGMRSV